MVSIILISWVQEKERLALLKKTIDSILLHTCQPFEIILVDNGDETQETYLQELWETNCIQKWIRNRENMGIGRARNQGVASAKGDYVCFMDNDIEVYDGWMKKCLEMIEGKKLIATPVRSVHTKSAKWLIKKEKDYEVWRRSQPIWVMKREIANKFKWPEYPGKYHWRPGTAYNRLLGKAGYFIAVPLKPYAKHIADKPSYDYKKVYKEHGYE